MLSEKRVLNFLREYCKIMRYDFNKADEQLHSISKDSAVLCVDNPDAPIPNGLLNWHDTTMLPTLFIREVGEGLEAEKTEYTDKYLSL